MFFLGRCDSRATEHVCSSGARALPIDHRGSARTPPPPPPATHLVTPPSSRAGTGPAYWLSKNCTWRIHLHPFYRGVRHHGGVKQPASAPGCGGCDAQQQTQFIFSDYHLKKSGRNAPGQPIARPGSICRLDRAVGSTLTAAHRTKLLRAMPSDVLQQLPGSSWAADDVSLRHRVTCPGRFVNLI